MKEPPLSNHFPMPQFWGLLPAGHPELPELPRTKDRICGVAYEQFGLMVIWIGNPKNVWCRHMKRVDRCKECIDRRRNVLRARRKERTDRRRNVLRR